MKGFPFKLHLLLPIIIFVCNFSPVLTNSDNEVVGKWAEELGDELWDLAQTITQREEIKSKYKEMNVSVEKKTPQSLLSEIVENVTRMLKRKMDAVRCILTAAEMASEEYTYNETETNLTYHNSKYSTTINVEGVTHVPELPESIEPNRAIYESIVLTPNSHFHEIPVNTSYSSVHVPTNVYDLSEEARTAIEWSEALDAVFQQNYNSDPALSWQFFGSSSGVMRHYPAMNWTQEVDLFDCRTRPWFIEAATCTKDVVILLDNSGSMTGMGNHTAQFTVSKILDTFSNNDFINIYEYNNNVRPLEPCFDDMLVQATKENIAHFKNKMKELIPEEYANLTLAMDKAFQVLRKAREKHECGEDNSGCNQAIMLVTDGVPNNVTEVFEKYNWLNNGSTIPVRVFAYLIGKEVSDIPNIKWMACLNRGYFGHIRSLDETSEQVLKYIPVIAQPLVLQGEDHPVSWTHAYITDNSFEEKSEGYENYRLLMSVAAPAFDRKLNQDNRTAKLLGVAGTDVPIEDLEQLTLPYKIGVNGYAFVVSNNGYLIMHPNLRPLYDGILNLNYNSMDLTEIEFMNDDLEPREINQKIKELRDALIDNVTSHTSGLPMKNFYDDMRRPYLDVFDYYYAPLENTPFSIAIAIPQSVGTNTLKVKDVIANHHHRGANFIEYFRGENWKVHPKWIYCKYRYLEGHEFKTPEEEVYHFLEKMSRDDWQWKTQYEDEPNSMDMKYNVFGVESEDDEFDQEVCARKTYANNDYFCDRDLMQRMVFDASVTHQAFGFPWKFRNDREEDVFTLYNATLRFVAGMSGLTRWQNIYGDNNNMAENFGETHSKSIQENWYKNAVNQHIVDAESFVYEVPFDSGYGNNSIAVTASHAIFPRDAGLETPGCVVGFQFQHSTFYNRFMEITSKIHCQDCMQPCSDDLVDCYLIDSNGYVVISENRNDTGRFFGEIESAVMQSMIEIKIYDPVTVYDFQAVCTRLDGDPNDASTLLTPITYTYYFLQWLVYKTMWMALETNLYSLWADISAAAASFGDIDYGDDDDIDDETRPVTETSSQKPSKRLKLRKGQNREEEEYFQRLAEQKPIPVYISEPCDKKATLYTLNQTKFISGEAPAGIIQSNCSRPYFLKRIPHSNLILIVVNASHQTCSYTLTSSKQDIAYLSNPWPCNKIRLNDLPRRKLAGCYNEHPMERRLYEVCDDANVNKVNALLFSFFVILTYLL